MRLALLLLLASCGGGDHGPDLDECSTPVTGGGIDSLAIGGPDDPFAPWPEGHLAEIVRGPQGGDMIATRLRVTGDGATGCMPQETRILDPDGAVLAAALGPVGFYEQEDGSRITRIVWVVFDELPVAGSPVTLRSSVGDAAVTQGLVLGESLVPDRGQEITATAP